MANIGRMIISGMSGGKSEYPWWADIAGDKPAKQQQTGQEILDNIITQVMGGDGNVGGTRQQHDTI